MKEVLYKYDPSGKYSRKKYLEENHIDLFNDILLYSKNNNIEDIPFKEIVYCYKHNITPPKCKNPNCNNTVKYKNSTIGYKDYCSTKCISNDPNIKKQKQEKSLKKYGTKTPAESKIVKDKIIKTNQIKFGVNSPMQLKSIQEKSKQTLLKNFGVTNPQKSKEIKEKRIKNFNVEKWRKNFEESMIEKYGVKNALQSEVIKLKTKKTNLKKHGVENVNQNKEINKKSVENRRKTWKYEKTKSSIKEKYGVNNIMELNEYKNKARLNRRKIEIDNNNFIIDIDLNKNIYLMKCDCGQNHIFEIPFSLYKSRKQFASNFCTICFPPYKNNISQLEIDLLNFIKEKHNEEIIINSKSIISPYEIDIYLPDLNLAFEFNGVYWHNELNKPNNYHKMKSDLCDEKGIQLIHIYEDDWLYKNDIIKSMILNKLGKSSEKIYARKTEIKEITDNKLVKDFLNNNHIQGNVNSSVKIGLFYDDELVSLMTFGKKRKNMNSKSNNEHEYEMLRFCNKLNTNVIGGASKIFKHFLRNFNPIEIVSYADRSYSNGNLYNQLGFELEHITSPNYHYIVDDKRKYRYGFRKDILVKEGYDKNKTEHEIMLERKIYRIYNSGNYKFVYKI